jgi:hypothetical protein
VRDHGSITDIYRALPDLPPRIAAALREGRERVERNLLLMSPLPHLDADLDDAADRGAPLDRIADLLEELGFAPAAARVRRALGTDAVAQDRADGAGRSQRAARPGRSGPSGPPPQAPPPETAPPPRG